MANGRQKSGGLTPEQEERREHMKERGRAHKSELDARHVDDRAVNDLAQLTRDRSEDWLRMWLPQRIERGMAATGLTVTSLAGRAGFHSEATLRNKMVSGQFTFGDMLAIASVFRVKLEWFISSDPFPKSEANYWHKDNRPPTMRVHTCL